MNGGSGAETIRGALRAHETAASAGQSLRAFVGFDGFVDTMFRVVRERGPGGAVPFTTISDFARHIGAAAGQSAELELLRMETRAGGNAPLLANALAALGARASCAGALGHPVVRPVFQGLHPLCERIPLAEPADTNAYEFEDGKLMVADLSPLEALDWALVRARAGEERLRARVRDARVVAFVNWGGLPAAQEIWQGAADLLAGVVAADAPGSRRRVLFVDLADISKRPAAAVMELVRLLRQCSSHAEVVLGLNEHEAWTMEARLVEAGALAGSRTGSLADAARRVYDALRLPVLVVHPVDRSLSVSAEGLVEEKGIVVKPLISTGGGDNFNAGWCLGRGLGLDHRACLVLGMTVSRLYVSRGRSPGTPELLQELAAQGQG